MIIKAENIRKSFGSLEVLKGIDFCADKGEVVSIVGASGAGKSTLLQILGTLSTPDGGSLEIDGTDVLRLGRDALADFRGRKIGFVFQAHHLLPEFTAEENVMIPAMIAGCSRRQAAQKAAGLLGLLGLADRASHKPSELSGGEQQRVAIARALLNRPQVIIADEPTGNLDPETAASIVSLLQAASKEGTAVVMSTHNIHLIDLFPGKVYRCKNRVFSLIDDGERQREMEEEDAEEMAQKG